MRSATDLAGRDQGQASLREFGLDTVAHHITVVVAVQRGGLLATTRRCDAERCRHTPPARCRAVPVASGAGRVPLVDEQRRIDIGQRQCSTPASAALAKIEQMRAWAYWT